MSERLTDLYVRWQERCPCDCAECRDLSRALYATVRAARAESEGTRDACGCCVAGTHSRACRSSHWNPRPAPASRDGQVTRQPLPVRTGRHLSGPELRDAMETLSPRPSEEDLGFDDPGPDGGTGGGR